MPNSIGTATVPLFTISVRVGVNTGFPSLLATGPIFCSKATPGLFGNAAASCAMPVGVGVIAPWLVTVEPAVRILSPKPAPKNHSLSLNTGPPTVAPK